tara:strand:- start:133 stop:459 length:327 start_codon:yes stop_codon:yes gene_type:complete
MADYGGSENFTVQHALNIMNDHVTVIEDINTNGTNSSQIPVPQTQANTNKVMEIMVGGLEAMLTWNGLDSRGNALPDNTQPDVAGYGGDKSAYTDAITLGETYIAANS